MASTKTKFLSIQSDIQEIQSHLRDKANELAPKWDSHYGMHDRPPGHRDIGDSAQLHAEIDEYVSYLFGPLWDDFACILGTLPVLKKKEEKIFDEFISNCKSLEKYDRIEGILATERGHS